MKKLARWCLDSNLQKSIEKWTGDWAPDSPSEGVGFLDLSCTGVWALEPPSEGVWDLEPPSEGVWDLEPPSEGVRIQDPLCTGVWAREPISFFILEMPGRCISSMSSVRTGGVEGLMSLCCIKSWGGGGGGGGGVCTCKSTF